MKFSRREVIRLALIGSGSLLLSQGSQSQALAEPRKWQEFHDSLPIPKQLEPVYSNENGYLGKPTDYYQITMFPCKQLIGGDLVDIWGYNGITPGPLIRQRGGDKKEEERFSVVRFINKLGIDPDNPEESVKAVVHLHGMASKPQYDGYAEDYIKNEEYKDYIYPNDRAATIWYHDHALDKTARNVKAGLLGMYIVEDKYERTLSLPKGEFDVPLILQEHPQILKGGSIESRTQIDRRILVNGALKPRMTVKRHKYRFRTLNAAPESLFRLTVDKLDENLAKPLDSATLVVIGTDGGLRENPVTIGLNDEPLEIITGERYEFIIDFNDVFERLKTTQVYLRLEELNPVLNPLSQQEPEKVLLFEIDSTPVEDKSYIPDLIRPVKRFECPEVGDVCSNPRSRKYATTLVFDRKGPTDQCLSGNSTWSINGNVWREKLAWRESKVASPPLGKCVMWTLSNPSGEIHPVHIHQIDLQFLARVDESGRSTLKPYQENCWKDTFVIRSGEKVRIEGRFGPWSGIYMIHCHNLKHEDCEMMVTFQVGDDDRDPSMIAPAKPLSQIDADPLGSSQATITLPPPEADDYNTEVIERFDLDLYGPD
jgi:FtsP/CotA-like multicopper oxidase with cupredoxin domain